MTRYARRLARRLASRNAGRSPLGAPPWRFWAPGPRFRLLGRPPPCNGGHLPFGSVQRAPRSQVVVPGGRGPEPPGTSGYEPPPRDATPRSAFRFALENAPSMSEAGMVLASLRIVVKQKIRFVDIGRAFSSPPRHSASLRALTPVFDGLWTRVSALMTGRGSPCTAR